MIGGFVQEQNVGTLHQGLDDRQALLPSPGERGSFRIEVREPRATEGFGEARSAFRLGHGRFLQCRIDD